MVPIVRHIVEKTRSHKLYLLSTIKHVIGYFVRSYTLKILNTSPFARIYIVKVPVDVGGSRPSGTDSLREYDASQHAVRC